METKVLSGRVEGTFGTDCEALTKNQRAMKLAMGDCREKNLGVVERCKLAPPGMAGTEKLGLATKTAKAMGAESSLYDGKEGGSEGYEEDYSPLQGGGGLIGPHNS